MLQLLERLDDGGKRRPFQGRKLLDPRTATLKQLPYTGLDVLWTNAREGRQGLVAQEGVFYAGLVSGIPAILGLNGGDRAVRTGYSGALTPSPCNMDGSGTAFSEG